jgi:16S rRNA (guanine(966)-N(2))-methyltransferase RsmD
MHVIAGSAKGRRLLTPKDQSVRPTSGRVKEALFSILSPRVPNSRFLDLFAGTGAIGIEAVSRGAAHAVFVEPARASLRLLRENLQRCGMTAHAEIIARPAIEFLRAPGLASPTFDLIFADPPYSLTAPEDVLSSVAQSVILDPNSIVILEHASAASVPEQIGRLVRTRQYRYGDTALSRFEVKAEGSAPV